MLDYHVILKADVVISAVRLYTQILTTKLEVTSVEYSSETTISVKAYSDQDYTLCATLSDPLNDPEASCSSVVASEIYLSRDSGLNKLGICSLAILSPCSCGTTLFLQT